MFIPFLRGDSVEVPFMPARVILQDFTGVPAVVDFAAMRDAVQVDSHGKRNPVSKTCLFISGTWWRSRNYKPIVSFRLGDWPQRPGDHTPEKCSFFTRQLWHRWTSRAQKPRRRKMKNGNLRGTENAFSSWSGVLKLSRICLLFRQGQGLFIRY